MRVSFEEDGTLLVVPETNIEAMALKYWINEYRIHGPKMLSVETHVPPHHEDER